MKKWTGGILIVVLALILLLRYNLVEIPEEETSNLVGNPSKWQSAYGFFRGNSENGEGNDASQFPRRRHWLDNFPKPKSAYFEGTDELYSLTSNISKEESKVILVWNQMRHLISRSDSLPETAQGIKEASVAWKELLTINEEEKALRLKNCSDKYTEYEHCPSSVIAMNKTSLQSETFLEIPCGLVQDSSITVIGIPKVDQGSFQIELVGSQGNSGVDLPIILSYNITIYNSNLTEPSVIIQNSWTAEKKWGVEERCPGRGFGSDHSNGTLGNVTVDDLVQCNEEVSRTVMKENHNSKNLGNVSNGSHHMNLNFPFLDGQIFSATLWVGLEGFHMTVDGRHETSFVYREKLEPWMVTGVKVKGGLELLSALANGLTISENPDLVNVEQLKAPLLPQRRILMLIGVFSTGNNFERRMAIRRSWMQYEAVRTGVVAVRFFTGFGKNRQVNVELWKEAQTYGDIQLLPFVDYYSLITLKTIAICMFGTKILPAKYIMKTDDDAFVRIDEIISSLKTKPLQRLLYGLISFDSTPDRDRDSKWYINEEEWPNVFYPPWAHGPGYIITRDIAKFIVQGHRERTLRLFKLEDVAMGIWIDQFNRSNQEVHYINDARFHNEGCEADYILAHYQGPGDMLCLWEKLQLENKPICCE